MHLDDEDVEHRNRMEMNSIFSWELGKGEHSRILFRKDGVELAELVYNPKNATQMSENMGISLRQVQRYLKQLSDLKLIVREGGRKNGIWKILDEEYEGFFKRI